MARASYRHGVAWIAENDAAGDSDARDVEAVRGYISTLLLADLFQKEPEQVAQDVVRYRIKNKIGVYQNGTSSNC